MIQREKNENLCATKTVIIKLCNITTYRDSETGPNTGSKTNQTKRTHRTFRTVPDLTPMRSVVFGEPSEVQSVESTTRERDTSRKHFNLLSSDSRIW